MKKFISAVCMIGMLILLSACDNDSGDGTAGGRGDFPDVSFVKQTQNGEERVICYNADSNVITTQQVCVWNCAYYQSNQPRWVELTFDEALICVETGVDPTTGVATEECSTELALVRERFGACAL